MASQTEPITTTDVLDMSGPLFYVGQTYGKSPLLSRAGLRRGFRVVTGNQFSMSNQITGDAAAQSVRTEDASIAAVTKTSYAGNQTTQNMEIHLEQYVQSYASMALGNNLSGVANHSDPTSQINTLPTQREAHLRQLAGDLEYSALRGTSQAWTNAATAGATGGLVTAIEAGSETAAAGASLSVALIETEITRMAEAGAEFLEPVIAANAFQIQQLNTLYGNAVQSITEGGTQVMFVNLPVMGRAEIVYDPILATDDLVFVDLMHFRPAFGIVPGKAPIFTESIGKVAGGEIEQLYTIFGIDYDNILFHGMISGLATS